MEKSPPSNSLILQKSIPFTNGTAVSSSRVKCIWNLNFFFLIKNAILLRLNFGCLKTEVDEYREMRFF